MRRPHGVLDEHNVIRTHPRQQVQKVIVRVVHIQRLAALEIHIEPLQRAVRRQVPQHGVQVLVVHEAALFGVVHLRVQRGLRVFEQHGDVSDVGGVAGADHLEEFAHGFEAQLAPVGGPDGAAAAGLPLEEEFVLRVEDAAAFVVDLAAGAQEGGGALEVLTGGSEVESSGRDEGEAVDFVS